MERGHAMMLVNRIPSLGLNGLAALWVLWKEKRLEK